MALLFVLKQHVPELALAEAKAAVHGWGWWKRSEKQHDGVVLFSRARKPPKELALTRSILKVLATCKPENLAKRLLRVDWDRHLMGKSYRFVFTKRVPVTLPERQLAGLVWKAQRKPRVHLMNPDVIVEVVLTEKRAYIGLRAKEYAGDFAERRAHLLPAPHPTGMHPMLSRALVQLTCANTIHDPFCGAGGFLIEAGLSGIRVSGGDIKPEMVKRARKNCLAYGLRPEIKVADATDRIPRAQAFIADLPYGRSTKPVDLKPLLEAFLMQAERSTRRVVIGMPYILPRVRGWFVRARFAHKIHKSLTRHFYVLERKR